MSFLVVPAQRAAAELGYENVTQPYNQFFGDNHEREIGDEIELGTAGRTVTKFEFEYFGNFIDTGTQTVKVRFYANDGEGSDSQVGVFGKPNTVLYESDVLPLTSGYNVITLTNLSVTVPDRFTWTTEFMGVSGSYGDSAGLTIYNPASVGFSYNDFWVKTSSGWETMYFPNFNPPSNFGARVETSPDTEIAITSQKPLGDGSIELTFTGPVNKQVDLETAIDTGAATNQWVLLHSFILTGTPITWKDASVQGATNRLYRLTPFTDAYMELGAPEISNGNTAMPLLGTIGKIAVIEGSDDFVHWARVKTNYFNAAQYHFTDPFAKTHAHRFYRGWFAADMPITLLSSDRLENGMVLLLISGPPGRECMIISSTDLKNWHLEGARTFSYTGGEVNYLDAAATNTNFKFYQATLLP